MSFTEVVVVLSNPFQVRALELACRGEQVSVLSQRLLDEIADDLANALKENA